MPALDEFFKESYLPYIQQNKKSWQRDKAKIQLSGEGLTIAFAKASCNRTLALLKEDNTRTRYFTFAEIHKIIKQAIRYPNVFVGTFIAYYSIRGQENGATNSAVEAFRQS